MSYEVRLARLERSAGRWRALAVAACGVMAVMVFSGAGKVQVVGQVLDVQKLRFVDAAGNFYGGVECVDGTCALVIGTPADSASVQVAAKKGRSFINLTTPGKREGIGLYADDKSGVITVHYGDGAPAFEVVPVGGKPSGVSLRTLNDSGSEIWKAPMTPRQ